MAASFRVCPSGDSANGSDGNSRNGFLSGSCRISKSFMDRCLPDPDRPDVRAHFQGFFTNRCRGTAFRTFLRRKRPIRFVSHPSVGPSRPGSHAGIVPFLRSKRSCHRQNGKSSDSDSPFSSFRARPWDSFVSADSGQSFLFFCLRFCGRLPAVRIRNRGLIRSSACEGGLGR